jgi:hypothetical protein
LNRNILIGRNFWRPSASGRRTIEGDDSAGQRQAASALLAPDIGDIGLRRSIPPGETPPEIPNPAAPLTQGLQEMEPEAQGWGAITKSFCRWKAKMHLKRRRGLNRDRQAEYAALYAPPDGACCAARLSAIAPIQVDPCPAVQPKQCPPTAIDLPASLE